MSTIPAFTFGGITRPELQLDPSGNIILDPAAQAFMDTYGTKALYAGCPPGTPFPPVTDSVSTPVDSNGATNTVLEGAAVNTLVGITAQASSSGGNAVTYSLIGDNSGGGFKIDPNTGVVSVANSGKIDFESSPGHAYTITVQATDGIFTASQNFTIGVSDVAPAAPVDGNAATNTVAEGAAVGTAVGVTAHSTDINGGTVTYSLTGDTSGGGFTVNAATGVVTVADSTKIDFESSAGSGHTYTVTVQASDGTLSSTTQAFTIAVSDLPLSTPVDTNPTANQVAEGAAVGTLVGLTASAIDPNGPATTYSLIGDTSGGGFTINATTGVVTVADPTKIDFESAAGHAYNVTVKADDGLMTTTQAFTIAVTDVAPSTPVDSNATANTIGEGAAVGTAVGVTAHSTDINGGTVTYSIAPGGDSSGGGFAIDPNTGVITVADSTKIDFESAPSHQYTVTALASDGTLTTPQTFVIGVTDVAPSAPVDSNVATNTIAEGAANGSTVGFTAHSSDINGGTVTYSLIGDSSGGGFAIDPNTGVVTVADSTKIDFESAAGHAYNVTVQASDGLLGSTPLTFTIAVTDVAPSTPVDSNATTNTIAEGAANGSLVGVTAHSTDVNSPASVVTYSLIGDTSGGGFTIDPNTGVVTVADSTKIDFESAVGHAYTVTARASDGTVNSTPQAFVIAVSDVPPSTPVDSDATANVVAVGAPAGTHVGVTASSTDVNGPAVTYSLVGDTSGGGFTINSATGVVTVADPTKIVFNAGHPSFDVTVDSSDGTLHNQQIFTIGVVVDAAPVVTAGHTVGYTENQAPTPIDPAVTVTDSDNANLAHATVQITGNYVIGEDVLGFINQNGITGSFDAATGTETLTGSSSVANYQIALESVTYFNTSDNPSGLTRTVTIIANDGTVDSAPATDTITVTPVNDPPVVTAGHTLNYTENQAATVFDPAIAVTDVDNTTLASATVQITGNYVNGQDILAFTNQNGITGTFDAATGTETLTGSSSVANYQTALESVTYLNTSDNPSGLARTVTIIANDGAANSTAATDTINVTPVDDPPVTTAGGTLNYLENQAASAIDPTVKVSDVDSANMTSATIQITGNYVNGQDILAFTNQNGITGSFNAATGTETLTGSSSLANYQTALDSVTYFNSSDNPSGLDRTVSYTVNDGTLNSNTSTSTIHVTPVNDPPVVTFGAITGFTEPLNGTPAANSTPITIAPNLTISDVDSTNLTAATFALNDLKPLDALSVSGHAGASGDIGSIHFDITSTANTETVTLTGTDTIAHYNAVLDLVQFNNTSENPDTTTRSYTVTAIDDGGTANGGNNTGSANTTETVTAVDDPPTASVPTDASIGTAFSHTNLAISGLSVADIDAGSGNVTATISSGNAGLTFTTAGLASFTNNGSHTVTLTGTIAQVNTALGTLVYNSDDGFTGSDTVTLNVNDNGNTGTGGPLSSGNQTFHVGVVPQVFYIDNTNAGLGNGTGTQADPFHSIAAFNAANPAGTGDYVVLEHGTGTYSEANGINLANGVNLIGGSQTLQFTNPVTSQVVTANVGSGTDPLIKLTAGSTDNAIDLLAGTAGHTIAHVNVDTTLGSGTGVSDDGNNVGTVAISNMLVDTAGGNGLTFTHGGTVTVTGTNHIVTGTGIALDISNTSIGSAGLTFHNIGDNGGTNGIVLNNTGTAAGNGGLTVTGDGSTAGSGGTIQNTVQGALFTSTKGLSLSFMNFTNPDSGNGTVNNVDNSTFNSAAEAGINLSNVATVTFDHLNVNGNGGAGGAQVGINGQNVSNLTISNSTVTGFGDNVGEGDVKLFNLSGTSAVTNSTFGFVPGDTTGGENLFEVRNNTGTLTLNVTGSTFQNTRDSADGSGGIALTSTGTAVINLNASHDTFSNLKTSGIEGIARQTSTLNANITDGGTLGNGNIFDPGSGTGRAIGLSAQDTAQLNFNINRNVEIKGNGGPVIDIASIGTAVVNGHIDNNTDIQNNGTTNFAGSPIFLNIEDSSTAVVDVTGNTISHLGGDAGIDAVVQGNGASLTNASLDVTIASNTINMTGSQDFNNAILLQAGGNSNDTTNIYADVKNNSVNLGASNSPVAFTVENTAAGSNIYLQGFTTDIQQTWAANGNTPGTSELDLLDHTSGAVPAGHNGGVVKTPSNPTALFAAASGVAATSPTPGEMHLTQAELNTVVAAAIAQWASAGLSADKIAALHQVTYDVADITSGWLGKSTPGHVTIDVSADGHGWFVDPTPQDNSEFAHAASATDLLADPSSASAGHTDLLTTVMHEMGEQLGLADKFAPSDHGNLMYAFLGTGERVLADAADATLANAATFSFQAIGTTAPAPVASAASPPIATGPSTTDAGQGGGTLVGTAGADNFVFAHVDVQGPPPLTHVANYSFAQGDTFDFSALTPQLHGSSVSDALVVRAIEGAGGSFATLQVNTVDSSLGTKLGSNWVSVAQIDGAHSGDALNVLVDTHSAVHVAQIHVDLLV